MKIGKIIKVIEDEPAPIRVVPFSPLRIEAPIPIEPFVVPEKVPVRVRR